MSTEQPPPSPPPDRGGWLKPVALILACLVLGFVGGWILRGDDGTVTVLEAGAPTATETTDGATSTAPAPPPTATEEAPAPPARGAVGLVVLNGTDTAGLAGDTASEAESVGYESVIAGNAPTSTDPSVVYHAADQQPAAQRVASDLRIQRVQPLPGSGPIAQAAADADPEADVVVVLGPS